MNQQIDWTAEFFNEATAEKFTKFHSDNPQVLESLVSKARTLKGMGHRRAGMKMLFELLRWDYLMTTETNEPFKLNNNYTAYYARLIENNCPDLKDFFAKRKAKSDELLLV